MGDWAASYATHPPDTQDGQSLTRYGLVGKGAAAATLFVRRV